MSLLSILAALPNFLSERLGSAAPGRTRIEVDRRSRAVQADYLPEVVNYLCIDGREA